MMKSELSSLLDDELASEHQAAVVAALGDDAELRATWHDYQLIGDALRSRSASHPGFDFDLDLDLTARVMAALQYEPVFLVPRRHARISTKQAALRLVQGGMRYAAALAGVGVVAWLALSAPQTSPQAAPDLLTRMQERTPAVAKVAAAQPPAAPAQATAAAAASEATQAGRLQSYLVAHQAYSPSNRFDGGAGYVRTVAATR